MSEPRFHMDDLLKQAVALRASDLHLTAGLPPTVRIDGDLRPLQNIPKLTPKETHRVMEEILSEKQQKEFLAHGSIDFSMGKVDLGRFRVNIFRQRGAVAIALRLIPSGVPNLSDLNMPPIVGELARKPSGLILVTGPTGSGKSTTLAAMIGQMNREERLHILTLEDPIEFLHQHGQSMINQREVGSDTPSFAAGLRSALREDPDVILVGEMRDFDTTQIAVSAAETGHLVLATLHTPSAWQTIDRIVDIFPPYQQSQIRVQLASSLQGVITQQLLPRAGGTGRIPALEIMVATPAVRNLIREGKTHQLPSVLQTNVRAGMVTMEASLKALFSSGMISDETYRMHSTESGIMRILE